MRASDYLITESIAPVLQRENMLAVWSRPEIVRNGAAIQAKLGGTGLGLVALLSATCVKCFDAVLEGYT